ncbi:MAG: DUF3515 family protein [Mycetocola reblochoni]|uniref:DUF3515 domain-containing protein n=2 Tax=Mycetocola reblochoni TaxID=331618 RepID=A0A3L6ZRC3_9MICO|nr:DUF3515 family protein [Mycetocola reblochoni]RLP70185.1 DUF3515 domain-containing protein [Mycetocola reblochoni]
MTARTLARTATAIATVAGALALTACSPTVTLTAAPEANDPACAEVTVRLPESVSGFPRIQTDAQATGAWGDDGDARILLHCGVPELAPTTDRCVDVDGIDWVIDESEAPYYRLTTYGRSPAVEVYLDGDTKDGEEPFSSTAVIVDLNSAVGQIPATGGCVGAEDLFGTETDGS